MKIERIKIRLRGAPGWRACIRTRSVYLDGKCALGNVHLIKNALGWGNVHSNGECASKRRVCARVEDAYPNTKCVIGMGNVIQTANMSPGAERASGRKFRVRNPKPNQPPAGRNPRARMRERASSTLSRSTMPVSTSGASCQRLERNRRR